MKYMIKNYMVSTEEDTYDEGCNGNYGTYWTGKDLGFDYLHRFDSIREIIEYVKENDYSFHDGQVAADTSVNDDGEVQFMFIAMVDNNNCPASENELELWKNGEMRLWIADGFLTIKKVVFEEYPILAEDIEGLGGIIDEIM